MILASGVQQDGGGAGSKKEDQLVVDESNAMELKEINNQINQALSGAQSNSRASFKWSII